MSVPALFTRHMNLAGGIATRYRIPGSEYQDVRQEALIALWVACRDHKSELGPFKPFAMLVINRRLASLLKAALRGKQLVLTEAVRNHDMPCDDACAAVLQRERVRLIVNAADLLDGLEREALRRIVNELPYLGRSDDNARQRVRAKLRTAA